MSNYFMWICIVDVTIKEVGLEGALFSLLDHEQDARLCKDIEETVIHMMSSATQSQLAHWLKLCKDVLSSACSGGFMSYGQKKPHK